MSEAEGGSPIRCPWCSAELPTVFPAGVASACPSCGAALTSATGTEPDIRGVTTLDHEAILRARSDTSRPRGRLLSFITGDTTTTAPMKPEELASLAPPDSEVRREMLRLELEAERAELEAESTALRTEAVMEQGLDEAADDEEGEPAGESKASTTDETATPARTTASSADETAEPTQPAEAASDADEDSGTTPSTDPGEKAFGTEAPPNP